MGVQGGACGPLGVFGDELEVAERGDQRDNEGDEEGQPDNTADLFRHLAGQRVDAGAQNVADDEEQQQPWSHHPVKTEFEFSLGGCAAARRQIAHRNNPFIQDQLLRLQNRSSKPLFPYAKVKLGSCSCASSGSAD